MSLKITHSDDRVLCVYVPSGHNTKKQLARGHLFKGLQNYMENRLGSNYVLSKLIIDAGLEGLWRGENLDSCEFTH